MFPQQLKKILNLIKRTRDRVVIFDASSPDESYVVMDFDNYESLASPLVSKQKPESVVNKEVSEPVVAPSEDLTEEDVTDKINREISMWKNGESSPFLEEENKSRPGWQIPSQVKKKAQEVKE